MLLWAKYSLRVQLFSRLVSIRTLGQEVVCEHARVIDFLRLDHRAIALLQKARRGDEFGKVCPVVKSLRSPPCLAPLEVRCKELLALGRQLRVCKCPGRRAFDQEASCLL